LSQVCLRETIAEEMTKKLNMIHSGSRERERESKECHFMINSCNGKVCLIVQSIKRNNTEHTFVVLSQITTFSSLVLIHTIPAHFPPWSHSPNDLVYLWIRRRKPSSTHSGHSPPPPSYGDIQRPTHIHTRSLSLYFLPLLLLLLTLHSHQNKNKCSLVSKTASHTTLPKTFSNKMS